MAFPRRQEGQRRHLAQQPCCDQAGVEHEHPPVAQAVLEDGVPDLGVHAAAVGGEESLTAIICESTASRGIQEVPLTQLAPVER